MYWCRTSRDSGPTGHVQSYSHTPCHVGCAVRDVGHSCVGIRAASASVLRSETSRPLQLLVLRSAVDLRPPSAVGTTLCRKTIAQSGGDRCPPRPRARPPRPRGQRHPFSTPTASPRGGRSADRPRPRASGWDPVAAGAPESRGAGSRAAAPRPLGPRPAALSARFGAPRPCRRPSWGRRPAWGRPGPRPRRSGPSDSQSATLRYTRGRTLPRGPTASRRVPRPRHPR